MVADLLPRVERSHLWFSENVELLFCAQIEPSCHRSEESPPIEHLPLNVEGGAPGGIMANMVLCVIPGQGNSKILNLVNSGSFDSPIFLYIPNDEKTSTGHLI